MFLKTLTIKGFKSFADTADLDLEPGVTVVVGPNGSGKSNVVDAIAWVLGAQAPSAVRSQKMDDVIFAGTSKKPALGRAEVALCLDNTAGLMPIDFAEVTITRTLFRSGDSEYAINGVPCRLLDIQELLSDSGVGRMQHVIISQGQIDAVLNAKPAERRLIIEEAAGVLKYRKRKEKSERRLAATDANLTRVNDLLREVRRGLRPLEKQADAARRHGALVEELLGLRRYIAGRELAQLKARHEQTTRTRAEHRAKDDSCKARLAELDTAVLAAESELNASGGNDIGDELTQFEAIRERARGIAAVLAERRRSLDVERESTVDAALISSLEADQARLRAELAECEQAALDLIPEADEVAAAEENLAEARRAFEQRWGEGVAAASGEAAGVRGELGALRTSLQRAETEAGRSGDRASSLAAKRARLAEEVQRLTDEISRRDAAIPQLDQARTDTQDARVTAETAADEAAAELAEAESERRSWQARADALAMALDAARAEAGAERLAGIDGVIGTLLDLVDVDEGWEAAFEAAAGDALAGVLVDGPDAARSALTALVADDGTGAVVALGVDRASQAPPPVGEPIRAHVRSERADVSALLDTALGNAVRVPGGWATGFDVALAHPDAVVVTDDGARFGGTSWRVGGSARGATGTALDEATAAAEAAADTVERARADRDSARQAFQDAKRAAADARDEVEKTTAARRRAADTLTRAERELADVDAELANQGGAEAELQERIGNDRDRIAELEAILPALEAEEAAAAEATKQMNEARAALDERVAAVNALRSDLGVRAAQLDDRRAFLTHRLGELDTRLERNHEAAREAAAKREALDTRARILERLASKVSDGLEQTEARLVVLREQRREQTESQRAAAALLDALRRERMGVEKELTETRERMQRAELDLNEINLRIEGAVDMMRRELDVDPAAAMDMLPPDLPDGTSPAAQVRELERELRIMGPINPLALEEFEQLQERHEFLKAQLDDVKQGRRELQKVIRAIDEQIVQTFAGAYADVAINFEQLFSTLFPGGKGSLSLTDPDNLLETGIEVEAKPSGKNVRKLSLLSGGERSLTALAFLFAVFRSRPSPFYVMDEVEAALDDVNLHRFLDLVAEFREEAQLVIVSHQKRTMEAADVLYGVTMQPGGSSKVVSEKGASARGAA